MKAASVVDVWLRVISAIGLCFLIATQIRAATSSGIALIHVTIIDVRDGSAKPDMTVLISDGRINAIGSSSEIRTPMQVRVVDGRNKFLIPGLWDMHVHSDGDRGALLSLLQWGITGARDMGGDVRKVTTARRLIAIGDWTGPRLLVAGPKLMGPPAEPDEDVWVIRSPEEARRAVASLAHRHVDFVKVHDGLSRNVFLAIAAAAKSKELPFVGHVPESMTPAEVSDLGQKSIEHLEFVPKPCLALFNTVDPTTSGVIPPGCDSESITVLLQQFAQNGTWLDPTIQSFRYFAPTQWRAIFAGFKKVSVQIRANKVPILVGTDWSSFLNEKGAQPGRCLHDELALLVDAGFTPAEVLRAATLNPAVFFGLSNSLGAVEVGKIADLVLLEADPNQDIHNTTRIAGVIQKGRLVQGKPQVNVN
ncbi:MAG: amidohydrolase family protein [Candidatus Sulfotelmatobacter sp.]